MTNQAAAINVLLSLLGGQATPVATKARKGRKAKGAKRTKLTDEQKAVNAKANADEAVALFTEAGYKNCVAHETIKTYGNLEKGTGWLGVGRKVKAGESAIRTSKGMPLFHLEQTEEMVKSN